MFLRSSSRTLRSQRASSRLTRMFPVTRPALPSEASSASRLAACRRRFRTVKTAPGSASVCCLSVPARRCAPPACRVPVRGRCYAPSAVGERAVRRNSRNRIARGRRRWQIRRTPATSARRRGEMPRRAASARAPIADTSPEKASVVRSPPMASATFSALERVRREEAQAPGRDKGRGRVERDVAAQVSPFAVERELIQCVWRLSPPA